jgi:NAD+ kinase
MSVPSIVSPIVAGIVVVPAAAHLSFNRALALYAYEELCVTCWRPAGGSRWRVDGDVAGSVRFGDVLTVKAFKEAARVVRLGYTTFYERTPEAAGQRQ